MKGGTTQVGGVQQVVADWLIQDDDGLCRYVGEGSRVAQFEKIAEVQSDKATVEITSRYDGVVKKVYYGKGDTARVGSPLVDIDTEDAEATTPEPAAETTPAQQSEGHKLAGTETIAQLRQPSTVPPNGANVKAMPSTRHLARINGVDLTQVRGTGRSGQITKEDVVAFMGQQTGSTGAASPPPPRDLAEFTEVPLNVFQRAMQKSMQAALSIPHFGFHDEIGLQSLEALRQGLKAAAEARHGVNLTLMAFFIKALSLALSEFPILNAHFDAAGQRLKHYTWHNVSVAVDTEHGLVVPVIKAVQRLSVLDVARELTRLGEAARANRLAQTDLAGGTITLSNIGTIGGTTASPVIVAPQVCIVALGRSQWLPRFANDREGAVVGKLVMPVSWSADHRVIDGATVARFSQRWRRLLEEPSALLLHLTQP